MKILLINEFFAPDPAPTGQLLADVARVMVANGHAVNVLCSRATYSDCDQTGGDNLEGIQIRRLGRVAFGRNPLARLVSYGSFFFNALFHTMFGRRADVVVTMTTPPLLSLVGTAGRYLRGSRHLIWEMDIYPDVAVGVGAFGAGSVPAWAVGMLADFSRRRADNIVTLGSCMRDLLIRRGIAASKIDVAENWANGTMISPRPFPKTSHLTLLYSGNLGRAHDFDTIEKAITLLTNPNRFRFVFAGGGSRRARLEALCQGHANAEFLPYQPHAMLADHLGRCHVGLVTQISGTAGALVPSKTYTLMAAGRPFIFIGPRESTPARLIRRFNCGWHIELGDHAELASLLLLLQATPKLVHTAGANARTAFLHSYDVEVGTQRIVSILECMNCREKTYAMSVKDPTSDPSDAVLF